MTTPGNMNIDFLLGVVASPEGVSPAGPTGVENGGPLFGEMLNEMLMSYPGAVNRPVVDADGQSPAPFELPNNGETVEIAEPGGKGDAMAPIAKAVLPFVTPIQLPETQPATIIAAQPNQMAGDGVVNSSDKEILSNAPIVEGAQPAVADNVIAFNKEIRALAPTDALPMQNTAIKMNLSVATNLEAGSYEVIESSTVDNTVKLKLADPSTKGGFIQVELPAESLTTEAARTMSEQPSTVKRVDLDAAPRQTTNIERLFAQLNLKQIEVSNVAVNDDTANDHLDIKLSGTKNKVDVELKAQLTQVQLRALKVEPQISPEAKVVGQKETTVVAGKVVRNASMQSPGVVQPTLTNTEGFDKQVAINRQEPTGDSQATIKQEATGVSQSDQARAAAAPLFAAAPAPKIRNVGRQLRSNRIVSDDNARSEVSPTPRTENDQLLNSFSQSLKQGQQAATKIANNAARQTMLGTDLSTFGGETDQADAFANLDTVRTAGKTDTGKLSTREVRFSLPDDIASKLKPNGQSVMIRINPEHLGPARLSLRMHQDKLSARITVETVGIKAIVEQSLDRLTQQLVKSGIDIERIEVALDGRQSGDQLSERHPHWQRQTRTTHFDENNLTETNEVNHVSPIPQAAPAYVGSGGVNMLA